MFRSISRVGCTTRSSGMRIITSYYCFLFFNYIEFAQMLPLPSPTTTLYDFMLGGLANDDTRLWFLDGISGERRTAATVKQRTDFLALGLQEGLGFPASTPVSYPIPYHRDPKVSQAYSLGHVVSIVSPNHIDFASCVWACQQLGCVVSPNTAGSTADELAYQFQLMNTATIIAHPMVLEKVFEAALVTGVPINRIVMMEAPKKELLSPSYQRYVSIIGTVNRLFDQITPF
jgi:hypothetical protein